mmetsp:Transcript_13484/g.46925  ORF Transcript_13484/g.46925 Transcript_13484/m.46925 type:complete len:208 (-) Transcript_13484:1454-2077(-)
MRIVREHRCPRGGEERREGEGIEFSSGKASPDRHYRTGGSAGRADEQIENLQPSTYLSLLALVVQTVRGRKFRQQLEQGLSLLPSSVLVLVFATFSAFCCSCCAFFSFFPSPPASCQCRTRPLVVPNLAAYLTSFLAIPVGVIQRRLLHLLPVMIAPRSVFAARWRVCPSPSTHTRRRGCMLLFIAVARSSSRRRGLDRTWRRSQGI